MISLGSFPRRVGVPWRGAKLLGLGGAAVAIAASFVVGVQQSRAAFRVRNGSEIAFVHNLSRAEVWSVTASGADLRRLTPPGVLGDSPSFSPNGRQIIYSRTGGEPDCTGQPPSCLLQLPRSELWTMNPDGSHQHQLTRTAHIDEEDPAWSPNGKRIAYSALKNNDGEHTDGVWVMNADGSHRHQLTRTGYNAGWSPDGSRIIYWTDKGQIFVIPATGGHARSLLPRRGWYVQSPDWSPDGRRIVFTRETHDDHNLWIVNADGSHPRQITHTTKYSEVVPSWAPDGHWIIYSLTTQPQVIPGHCWLYLIHPNGKGNHLLTRGPKPAQNNGMSGSENGEAAWQPH